MFTQSIKSALIIALSTAFIPLASHASSTQVITTNKVNEQQYTLSLTSFDGAKLNARLQLPKVKKAKYPVLISLHGMARSQNRVWQAEYKGGKTLEQTHRITEMALDKGFAVLALDARHHGERKVKEIGLVEILQELENDVYDNYNKMILDTVADYKSLITNLSDVTLLEPTDIHLVGYSMGAQMALLLAAELPEVTHVYAMVPPELSEERAKVSPVANVEKIAQAEVILFTANHDRYATQEHNSQLFNRLTTEDKLKVEFNSDHLLPAHYVSVLDKLWSL